MTGDDTTNEFRASAGRRRRAVAPHVRAISAALLIVALVVPAAAGTSLAATYLPGSIKVNAGAIATRSADVTLALSPPTDAASRVRIANDGSTWVEAAWGTSLAWSLTDPAAGGVPDDGIKTVSVQYGDGTSWSGPATDSITYDRTPPSVSPPFLIDSGAAWSPDWVVNAGGGVSDSGGVSPESDRRVSLDGIHWSGWGPSSGLIKLREIDLGGTWAVGTRTVWAQYRDIAGNLTAVTSDDIELPDVPSDPANAGPLNLRFEFPLPAITGQPFTIRPVYPPGFVMPTKARCQWLFIRGDEEAMEVQPNETYGEILFDRTASQGGCGPWTFTLPYGSALRYRIIFGMEKNYTSDEYWGTGTGLYDSPAIDFHAQLGTTDPAIHESNIPIAYLLPDSTTIQTGDPTTYRLYATDAATPPNTGMFWAYPIDCSLNPSLSQVGGASFTYRPNCSGPWVTGWTGRYHGGYMRSQYDPIADGRAPTVTAPVMKLRTGAGFSTVAPASINWSATDSGSGVWGYEAQISRNGGPYVALSLPTRLTTTVSRNLGLTGTHRARVRARDVTGNWSGWVYGPVLTARVVEDGSSAIAFSTGWTIASDAKWSGGTARTATAKRAKAVVSFTGSGIAWVTGRGPDRGIAEIRIDGNLVASVDLGSPAATARLTAFSQTWATVGAHTVAIRVLGTSGRPTVGLDAFLILR